MKRNPDLIRQLMLEAEDSGDWQFLEAGAVIVNPTPEQDCRAYHLRLLCDAGYFQEMDPGVFRLTNSGHDWLDMVRQNDIWTRTKAHASRAGGASLRMLGSIAEAYIKGKLADNGVSIA